MKRIKTKPHVTILIPAFNEEKTIKKIVKDSLKIKEYRIDVIVAIDGKTTDKTRIIAKSAGAKVLHKDMGKDKGIVVARSIPHLRGDYVVQIDADYQFLPSDIPRLVKPLINGWDVTLGTRYAKGAHIEVGSVTPLKKIGSFVLSGLTSIVTGEKITDVMAGFKGFKREVLRDLDPQTHHFGYEAELVIKAARKKYKILNVPIHYRKRVIGASNIQLVKHGLLVLGTILKTGLGRL